MGAHGRITPQVSKNITRIEIDHKRGINSYHSSHTNETKLTLVTGRRAGEMNVGKVQKISLNILGLEFSSQDRV